MPETNLDDDLHILRDILAGAAHVRYADGPMGRAGFVFYNGIRLLWARWFRCHENSENYQKRIINGESE